jgi:hypothetical protein
VKPNKKKKEATKEKSFFKMISMVSKELDAEEKGEESPAKTTFPQCDESEEQSDYSDRGRPLTDRIEKVQATLDEAMVRDERKMLQTKELKLLREYFKTNRNIETMGGNLQRTGLQVKCKAL